MWQTHQIIGTQEKAKTFHITVGATAVLPYRGPPTAGLQSPVCLHRTSGSASGQPPTDKTTTWISSFLPRTAWSGCSEYSTNKEHLMKTQLKTMSCLAECSRFINKTCNKTAKLLWNLSLDCQMDYRDLFHPECFMCAPTAGACSAGLHSQACFGQKDEVTAEQVEKSQMDWLGVSGFSGPADLWLIQRSFICSFLWLCVSPSVYGTAVTHTCSCDQSQPRCKTSL